MLAVVCMKWGTAFSHDYVNVLHSGVIRNVSEPVRFICFTDDPRGLRPGIEVREIPNMQLAEERKGKGCWPKLALFKPSLVEDVDLMLYLDLDVIINSSLDPLITRARERGGFHTVREWNYGLWTFVPRSLRPVRGVQSSVCAWRPEEYHYIYLDFMADQEAAYRRDDNDQLHLTRAVKDLHYLPYHSVVSFKRSCLWYYPLNRIFREVRKPEQAQIIIFHGRPRPHDLVQDGNARWGTRRKFGFGPVPWVKDYWLAGLRG